MKPEEIAEAVRKLPLTLFTSDLVSVPPSDCTCEVCEAAAKCRENVARALEALARREEPTK